MSKIVLETTAGGKEPKRGKVRDVYEHGDEHLVIVSTDRVSAFDVVLPTGIPGKGKILHGISKHWFETLKYPNHYLTDILAVIGPPFSDDPETFDGRTMLVKKADVVPVECVVRSHLAGSAYKKYLKTGYVGEAKLPDGMRENMPFRRSIFDPTTKAEQGQHDEPITLDQMTEIVKDPMLVVKLATESVNLFERVSGLLWEKSIILADTKLEFGLSDGKLILVDEAFTPDSSRFWPFGSYEIGKPIHSKDKQLLRDWLTAEGWEDYTKPPPKLEGWIVDHMLYAYADMYKMITGKEFKE